MLKIVLTQIGYICSNSGYSKAESVTIGWVKVGVPTQWSRNVGVPVCSSVTYLGLCSSWNSTKATVFDPSFLMLHEGNELGVAGCIYMN